MSQTAALSWNQRTINHNFNFNKQIPQRRRRRTGSNRGREQGENRAREKREERRERREERREKERKREEAILKRIHDFYTEIVIPEPREGISPSSSELHSSFTSAGSATPPRDPAIPS